MTFNISTIICSSVPPFVAMFNLIASDSLLMKICTSLLLCNKGRSDHGLYLLVHCQQSEIWSSHFTQYVSGCTWSTVSSSDHHNSKKKCTDWIWTQIQLNWGKSEGVIAFQPGEEKGVSHHSFPVLTGWIQRGWGLSLHKQLHGQDKGQQVPVPLGKVSV